MLKYIYLLKNILLLIFYMRKDDRDKMIEYSKKIYYFDKNNKFMIIAGFMYYIMGNTTYIEKKQYAESLKKLDSKIINYLISTDTEPYNNKKNENIYDKIIRMIGYICNAPIDNQIKIRYAEKYMVKGLNDEYLRICSENIDVDEYFFIKLSKYLCEYDTEKYANLCFDKTNLHKFAKHIDFKKLVLHCLNNNMINNLNKIIKTKLVKYLEKYDGRIYYNDEIVINSKKLHLVDITYNMFMEHKELINPFRVTHETLLKYLIKNNEHDKIKKICTNTCENEYIVYEMSKYYNKNKRYEELYINIRNYLDNYNNAREIDKYSLINSMLLLRKKYIKKNYLECNDHVLKNIIKMIYFYRYRKNKKFVSILASVLGYGYAFMNYKNMSIRYMTLIYTLPECFNIISSQKKYMIKKFYKQLNKEKSQKEILNSLLDIKKFNIFL